MRIRKHAKISPLLFTASSLNPATVTQTHHVCQLNQSPWDVMTFPPQDPATLPPPPPFLVDKEYYRSYMANRTFANHIAAGESPKKEKWDDIAVAAVNHDEEDDESSRLKKEEEEITLCRKTDKKGWQCGKRVKNGHSFCDHHLPKGKSHGSNSAAVHSKNCEENRRRARPRKPAPSSSNPYEFYYYSGFGPRWGKKRGTSAAAAAVKREPYLSPESGSGSGSGSGSDTSSTSKNVATIIEDADNGGPNPNVTRTTATVPNNNVNVKVSVFSQFENHGRIDYVEDEEDDYDDDDDEYEEEDNGEIGKKRGRKPIKARSLKSLM